MPGSGEPRTRANLDVDEAFDVETTPGIRPRLRSTGRGLAAELIGEATPSAVLEAEHVRTELAAQAIVLGDDLELAEDSLPQASVGIE